MVSVILLQRLKWIISYSRCPWKKVTLLLYFTSQHWLVMTAHMTPLLCCGKCLSAIHCVSVDCTCNQDFRCSSSFQIFALFSHTDTYILRKHFEHGCVSLKSVQSVGECMIVSGLGFHLWMYVLFIQQKKLKFSNVKCFPNARISPKQNRLKWA